MQMDVFWRQDNSKTSFWRKIFMTRKEQKLASSIYASLKKGILEVELGGYHGSQLETVMDSVDSINQQLRYLTLEKGLTNNNLTQIRQSITPAM